VDQGMGSARKLFVHHSPKITLKAATVDLRAEQLEVLDGQLTVLDKKAERFGLPLIQLMLL